MMYFNPVLKLPDRRICADQIFKVWRLLLGLSSKENNRAMEVGFQAMADCASNIRRHAPETLDELEREDRMGIAMLGRVYHHDPKINHAIMKESQKIGDWLLPPPQSGGNS